MKNIRKIFREMCFLPFYNILLDEETFNYTLKLFNKDYNAIEKYENFLNLFKKEFDNYLCFNLNIENYNKQIKKYYNKLELKDKKDYIDIINELKNKKDELMEDRLYLSIDLSSAFDLIIDKFGNLEKSIQEIRESLTDKTLLNKNKRVRIYEYITNGIMKYQDYTYIILNEILNSKEDIISELKNNNCSLVNVRMDELIFDISGLEKKFDNFIEIKKILDYNVHIKIFKYHCLYYKDYKNVPHKFEIRELSDKNEYIMRSCPYFNQIYKKYNNLEFNELDLRVPTPDIALEYEQKEKPIEFINKEEYLNYYLALKQNDI